MTNIKITPSITAETKTLYETPLIEIWQQYIEDNTLKHNLIVFDIDEWNEFKNKIPLIDEAIQKEITK